MRNQQHHIDQSNMVYSGYMLCVCIPGMDRMSICHHSKLILEV